MNRVKVTIGGVEYKIASDESASYILEVARKVDDEMRELTENNPRLSSTMAAVLTAVNAVDAAHKAVKDADNLRTQLKLALDENEKLLQQLRTGQMHF